MSSTTKGAFGFEIDPKLITMVEGAKSKHDALEQLIGVMVEDPAVTNAEVFDRAVHEREAVMSTGIGGGVAIPHVRLNEINRLIVGVGIAPEGIDYGTLDNEPVHVMVLFATPEGADKEYLRLLAQVMGALRAEDHALYEQLIECTSAGEVAALLNG